MAKCQARDKLFEDFIAYSRGGTRNKVGKTEFLSAWMLMRILEDRASSNGSRWIRYEGGRRRRRPQENVFLRFST